MFGLMSNAQTCSITSSHTNLSGGLVSFTITIQTPSQSGSNFLSVSFGDGDNGSYYASIDSTASSVSFDHQYHANDTFNVKVWSNAYGMVDTTQVQLCNDSTTDIVNIADYTCSLHVNSVISSIVNGLHQTFYANYQADNSADTLITWRIEDSTGANLYALNNGGYEFQYSFPNAGHYRVWLIVGGADNTTQVSCIDSAYADVDINNNPVPCGLHANISTWYPTSDTTEMFVGNSMGTNYLVNYFTVAFNGDTTTYFTDSLDLIYLDTGIYHVCYHLEDSACADVWCNNFIVNFSSSCSANLNYYYDSINPLVIHFVDNSITAHPSATTYSWSFSDGTTSSEQNPDHTFPDYGGYTTYLTINDTIGGSSVCTSTVMVSFYLTSPDTSACTAYFEIFPDSQDSSVWNGYNYSTTNNPSSTSYLWDFGDGATSNLPYPSHNYASPGNYIICLTVTDNPDTCSAAYCDSSAAFRMSSAALIGSLTISAPEGIKEIIKALNNIFIHPNPMADASAIAFESASSMNGKVEVVNLLGAIVYSERTTINKGANEIHLNTSSLAPGMYYVNIVGDNQLLGTVKAVK